MLILALDTSSPFGSVAVVRDDRIIGLIATRAEEIYSSRIFRHVDFILHDLAIGLEQVDVFAVAAGPGSFTGLRVGLTAVKGWAEVYGKPISAVSALGAVAIQSSARKGLVVPVLDARRSQLYFGVYRTVADADGAGIRPEGEECVATPQDFSDVLRLLQSEAPVTVATPSPELVSPIFSGLSVVGFPGDEIAITIERVSSVLAPSIGRLASLQAQRGELVDALTLNANYVRRSDAEHKWTESKTP